MCTKPCTCLMNAEHRKAFVDAHKAGRAKTTQVTLSDMAMPSSKMEKVISAGLTWIIKDFQPFSAFDSEAFREFLSVCNPMLKPPCAATVRGRLTLYREQLVDQVRALVISTMT
ncbi:hypothetical protein BGZ65_006376, partial [Modicella reniformis]